MLDAANILVLDHKKMGEATNGLLGNYLLLETDEIFPKMIVPPSLPLLPSDPVSKVKPALK